MKNASRAISVATTALLLAVASGCSNSPDRVAPSPTPTPASSAPTTTAPPSETKVASEAASQLVRTYYAVRDELRQQPKASLDKLTTVAISTELSAQQNLFKRERKDGLHQVGTTKIAKMTVQTVNLDNSNPKVGKVPTVQVDVCYDVSGADLVDEDGKSVVNGDRADTGWIRYTVSNYKWASDPTGDWRVATSENIERTPCAAS